MWPWRVGSGLFLATLLLAAPTRSEATVVRGLSLYEKTKVAPLVIRAEVLSVESSWYRGEGVSIKTLITLKVLETLKGDVPAGSRVVLRQAGGKIGDFIHQIPGTNPYKVGEQAILFLEPYKEFYVEIGIGIGKYDIEGAGATAMVTHDPKVALAYSLPGQPMQIKPATPMIPEPLPKFLTRVRDYISGVKKPRTRGEPRLRLRHFRPVLERAQKIRIGRD